MPECRRGEESSVSKRTILFLSIGAIILGIVGWGVLLSAAANCASTQTTTTGGAATCSAGAAGGAAIATLVLLLAGLLTFVAWLLGIIKTARMSRWGWFVVVLLL